MRFPVTVAGNPIHSFVVEGDVANLNYDAGSKASDGLPLCPCITRFRRGVDVEPPGPDTERHAMYTARECSRRYFSDGGIRVQTTSYHCWRCGHMKIGDSWHCPVHQTDFCQRCEGPINRMALPKTWLDEVYVKERKTFQPALE